jgi:hypothetical protein
VESFLVFPHYLRHPSLFLSSSSLVGVISLVILQFPSVTSYPSSLVLYPSHSFSHSVLFFISLFLPHYLPYPSLSSPSSLFPVDPVVSCHVMSYRVISPVLPPSSVQPPTTISIATIRNILRNMLRNLLCANPSVISSSLIVWSPHSFLQFPSVTSYFSSLVLYPQSFLQSLSAILHLPVPSSSSPSSFPVPLV